MRRIILVSLIVTLTACQTPYQPNGFGGGYEDIQLSEDVFEIRARGNDYSSQGHTRDIMLLRASDLAIQKGFTHFAILSGSMAQSQEYAGTLPGNAQTTSHATLSGNTIYANASTIYTPAQPIIVTNQHGVLTVKMLRQAAPNALDARLIYDQLKKKLT